MPILSKLLESVLRARIEPYIETTQNSMQRGFTKNSSPMNCSLILEEYIRENRYLKKDSYIAFLDAKAAFDVVNHSSVMRKLFHIGLKGVTWNLIHSLHKEAQAVVRWCGQTPEPFEVQQGVRQGGVLSTDLYKVYSNHLLDRVTGLLFGGMVDQVCCAAPACADDMTLPVMTKKSCRSLLMREATMVGWSDTFYNQSRAWLCQFQGRQEKLLIQTILLGPLMVSRCLL